MKNKLIIDDVEYPLQKIENGKFSADGPFATFGGHLYATIKKPVAKVIFSAQDGREYYEGEEDTMVFGILPQASWEKQDTTVRVVSRRLNSAWIYFSTKELRDGYMIENKPTFSYNEIVVFLDAFKWKVSPDDMPRLKQMAKDGIHGI